MSKYPGNIITSGAAAGYSVAFDGTGDYLTIPSNAAFSFGTGDFQIEFFVYARATGLQRLVFFTVTDVNQVSIGVFNNYEITYFDGTNTRTIGTVTANTWNHVAVAKSSGTVTCWLNGTRTVNALTDNSNSSSNRAVALGGSDTGTSPFTGYLSNVRILKGGTTYSGATINVPTQLFNVPNTQLLTCNSPAIIDQSPNAFAITANGNAAASTFTPFTGYTAYNPALGASTPGVWTVSEALEARQTRRWNMYDPYFNYTTLLLHGNGTNGAQNNTFLDSSSNNFTITRNGNTTQGTFTPFSQTGWSNYFDGTGDYLSFPNSSNFAFGTGSFTIEFWVNSSNLSDSFIFSGRASIGTMHVTYGGFGGTTPGCLRYVGSSTITTGSTLISNNSWNHCAIVRNGSSNITLYVNGVSAGTGTDTTNYTTTSGTWYINANDDGPTAGSAGYISNMRILKGTALYTSSFTPPTAPLTAITNTSLLTCQSNRFIDNSSSAITITVVGNPSVQPFSPFYPVVAYTPQAQGGSGYFDGTGDYLTVGAASDWTFLHNGSDWTIEFDVYYSNTSAFNICGTTGTTSQTGMAVTINDIGANIANVSFVRGVGGSFANFSSNAVLRANQWNHVAFTFTSSTKTGVWYINGSAQGSTSNTGFSYSSSNPSNTLAIGAVVSSGTPGGYLNGYQANLRISTNVRTGLTTLPTAPYTNDANTKLLANFTNAGILDSTGDNVLETVGNAQISTTQSKFGGSSMSFDGTANCRVQVSSSAAPPIQNIGTGDYTVELWVRVSSFAAQQMVFDYRTGDTTGQGVGLYINTSGQAIVFYSSANRITSSALSTNTWTHIALVRSSGTYTLYIGGTSAGTWANSDAVAPPANRPYIGEAGNGGQNFNGYIDDFRITRYARYTGNFTPQTSQWQDQ